MKREVIEKILIAWDPYGTIGYGPIDEYKSNSIDIMTMLGKGDISHQKLMKYLESMDSTQGTTHERIKIIVSLIMDLQSIIY